MNDLQPANFKQYTRRCFYVFFAVICGTLLMVASSFAPLPNHGLRMGLILTIALVNAVTVAGYLMHLVTEKRFVATVLIITVFFFIALLGLSVVATYDVPKAVNP